VVHTGGKLIRTRRNINISFVVDVSTSVTIHIIWTIIILRDMRLKVRGVLKTKTTNPPVTRNIHVGDITSHSSSRPETIS